MSRRSITLMRDESYYIIMLAHYTTPTMVPQLHYRYHALVMMSNERLMVRPAQHAHIPHLHHGSLQYYPGHPYTYQAKAEMAQIKINQIIFHPTP